ncbi:MAG: hypothetical protein Q7R45_12690 [Sulfuricaulis sp.]|nr:hypothetical protein [Sulfuricaulis sp.]
MLWVSQLLKTIPGARTQRIYFDDGDNPANDVREQAPLRAAGLEPLRRLFAHGHVAGYLYRNHAIPKVDGGTERAALVANLEQEITGLRPGDRLLIVFNGHGSRNRRDPKGNRLWLWNGTSLDVREFDALLTHVPPVVPVRFVFTQCYAGAFARLAPGPDGNRCGFLAESEDREAEGCAAGVDAGDYRDYTTYFFAALSGRTRLDAPLPVNPDLDGDEQVSLYEAHLYALRAGESADLPRSTSEAFLERWQPWYADWRGLFGLRGDALPNNVYTPLAQELGTKLDLPMDDKASRRALKQRRAELQSRARVLQRHQRGHLNRLQTLQREIQQAVAERHPELGRLSQPETLTDTDAETREIIRAIGEHLRYPELVRVQDAHATGEDDLLAIERSLSRLDTFQRFKRLARWQGRFVAEASTVDRTTYEKLLACEQQGL